MSPLKSAKTNHPWLRAYPETVAWEGPIRTGPVFGLMERSAERFPDRPCLDFLGRRYTYAETLDLVNRAARGFQDLGVGRGIRVGLCLPNSPYFVICYYAILKAGGTVVNFNPLYARDEMTYQVEDSVVRIMVTLDLKQIYPKVARLLESTGLEKIVVCPMRDILPTLKGMLFSVLKRSQLAPIPDDEAHLAFATLTGNGGGIAAVTIAPETDIAVLQYTGGTTGTPKGAMLTHANVTANTEQIRLWSPNLEPGQERMLAVIPFFHVFAMTVAMNLGIATGAELILLPRFELDQVIKTIDEKKPTLFPGVPTIFSAIVHAPDAAKANLASLKFGISGGAPLPGEVKARFEEMTGCVLVEGYGLSECSPVATCNPLMGVNKTGSIGLPLPGTVIEVHALNGGEAVAPGGKGEICVSGPQVMAGYWNNPGETAEILRDGVLRTGDVGYMDDDGYVFIIDRLKDLILCSGYKVYPRVVEEAIHEHPAVEEVTVIGVEDAYRGQTPKAFIKLKKDQALTEGELKAFLKDRLSAIEMPKQLEFREALPKTMIGKLSKKELVEEERAGGGEGSPGPRRKAAAP